MTFRMNTKIELNGSGRNRALRSRSFGSKGVPKQELGNEPLMFPRNTQLIGRPAAAGCKPCLAVDASLPP